MRNLQKLLFILLIPIVFILAACNLPEVSQSPASRMSDIQTEAALSATPYSKSPSTTTTAEPSSTPIPNTPTAYPTFHPELGVTATPAQPAVCPIEDPAFIFNDELLSNLNITSLPDFVAGSLDAGASFSQIYNKANYLNTAAKAIYQKDLTGDSVNELIVGADGQLDIYTCSREVYRNILHQQAAHGNPYDFPKIVQVRDLNLNNVADIAITYLISENGDQSLSIYEWNGEGLQPMLVYDHGPNASTTSRVANGLQWNMNPDGYFWMSCQAELRFADTDYNGT